MIEMNNLQDVLNHLKLWSFESGVPSWISTALSSPVRLSRAILILNELTRSEKSYCSSSTRFSSDEALTAFSMFEVVGFMEKEKGKGENGGNRYTFTKLGIKAITAARNFDNLELPKVEYTNNELFEEFICTELDKFKGSIKEVFQPKPAEPSRESILSWFSTIDNQQEFIDALNRIRLGITEKK